MKKFSMLSLLLAIAVSFSACGLSKAAGTEDFKDLYYSTEDSVLEKAENGNFNSSVYFDSASQYPTVEDGSTVREEKLVYTSSVTLESEDFEAANSTLHSTIAELGGIIVSEQAYNLGNVGYRSVNLTVRIPQEHYDTFLSGMETSYNVVSVRNTVDNLTDYYYDNENRLRSYRVQEERLFEMLEKAETVEEMLKIEERLCDVQYQIESLTNTQKGIDNDVKYSTFHITLSEVTKYTSPTPKTFGDRLKETFNNSAEMFAEFSENFLFAIIYLAPYIVIFAIAFAIGVAVIKNKKKKKAKKSVEEKNEK